MISSVIKIKYLVFLLFLAYACKSQNEALFEIDPRNFVDNKITLSEIADDIKYIPLDNNIPFIDFKYVITPGFIYVASKNNGILKFDRQGKLIKKIGNEKTGNIFVQDYSYRIKVYSQNGTFLRDIRLNEIVDGEGWDGDIEISNSLLFYPNSLGSGNSKLNWVILDTLGNLVSCKENSLPPFQTNIGREAVIYKFEDKLFYYNFYNDTIFSISPDLSYRGEYIFTPGNHRYPKMIIKTITIKYINSVFYNVFEPFQMFETKHFILLGYGYLDKAAFCLINKKTKETFLAYKYVENSTGYRKSSSHLINDLDGGLPLKRIRYYFENNEEYFTSLISPFELKLYISTDEFKNSTPKYPEKKKELEKLANSLKETDNPILMMVRLKK